MVVDGRDTPEGGMSLKQDLHDRLWHAFQRWESLRATGVTKRALKLAGLREHGDVHHALRPLIFTGNTLRTYEAVLERFLDSCPAVERLEDIGRHEFRAFMDKSIAEGLKAKTLKLYASALAKFGALTGQSESFAVLADKYARRIRKLQAVGTVEGPPAGPLPSMSSIEPLRFCVSGTTVPENRVDIIWPPNFSGRQAAGASPPPSE